LLVNFKEIDEPLFELISNNQYTEISYAVNDDEDFNIDFYCRLYNLNLVYVTNNSEVFTGYLVNMANFKLQKIIFKKASDTFLDESRVSQNETLIKVTQIAEQNFDHPGAEHIVKLVYTNKNITLLEQLQKEGNLAYPLAKFAKPHCAKIFLHALADVSEAYSLLAEYGLVPFDGTLYNIVITDRGGVLVDIGSFLDLNSDIHKVYPQDQTNALECHKKNGNKFTIIGSEPFYDRNCLLENAKASIDLENSAKISLAFCLGKFLASNNFIDPIFFKAVESFKNVDRRIVPLPKLQSHDRHNQPNEKIKEIYDLFLELIEYWYDYKTEKENLSLMEIAKRMRKISDHT